MQQESWLSWGIHKQRCSSIPATFSMMIVSIQVLSVKGWMLKPLVSKLITNSKPTWARRANRRSTPTGTRVYLNSTARIFWVHLCHYWLRRQDPRPRAKALPQTQDQNSGFRQLLIVVMWRHTTMERGSVLKVSRASKALSRHRKVESMNTYQPRRGNT